MITDRIGRHEVLLPINHNYNKICDVLALLKIKKTQEIQRLFLLAGKKRPFKGQMNQNFDLFYFSSILVKCV